MKQVKVRSPFENNKAILHSISNDVVRLNRVQHYISEGFPRPDGTQGLDKCLERYNELQTLVEQQKQELLKQQRIELCGAIMSAKNHSVGSASNRYDKVKECMEFVSDEGEVEAVWAMLKKNKGAFNEHRGWGQLFGKYAGATTTWKAVVGAFVDKLNGLDAGVIGSVDSAVLKDIRSACEDCGVDFGSLTQDTQHGRSSGTHR
jgi:hypothetical protein